MEIDAKIIVVPAGGITDWASFHDVFKETFGRPGQYDALVGCSAFVSHRGGKVRKSPVIALTLIGDL